MGTGREHHLASPHQAQALAGIAREAFRHRDEVLVVVAERGRPGEHRRPGVLLEPGLHFADPLDERPAAREGPFPERRAADPRTGLDEDGARARPGGRERGREAGRPAPHHEHVAEVVRAVVAVRVRDDRRAAEARRAPDEPLVKEPARRGPHEGLVVETGRKEK